jgi:hypothetical protein
MILWIVLKCIMAGSAVGGGGDFLDYLDFRSLTTEFGLAFWIFHNE